MEWLDIIQGPIDMSLTQVHCRSKGQNCFFANSVLNCRKESRHKLKSGLFNSLNSFVYGRRIDVFERQIEVNGQRGQITMK